MLLIIGFLVLNTTKVIILYNYVVEDFIAMCAFLLSLWLWLCVVNVLIYGIIKNPLKDIPKGLLLCLYRYESKPIRFALV